MVGLYCKTGLRNSSDSKNQFTNSIELIRLLIAEEFLNSNEEARQYKILSLASFPREFCTILVVPRLYWPVWSAIMDLEEVGRLFNFKRWIDDSSKTPQFIFFNFSVNKSKTSMLSLLPKKSEKEMENCPIIIFREKLLTPWDVYFSQHERWISKCKVPLLLYCYFIYTNWWI